VGDTITIKLRVIPTGDWMGRSSLYYNEIDKETDE